MRQIKILAHMSLDGVIQPTGDDEFANGGWSAKYRSAAGAESLAERQGSGYDLLLARRTYDVWAAHWPKVKGGPFAEGINSATKFVATHRPEGLEWGPVQRLGPDVAAAVRDLKSQNGPDLLVWGSTKLTALLFEHGLVDEVVLLIYPVLLGAGVRFFSDRVDARELALTNAKTTPTGVQVNSYRYVGAARPNA